MPGMAAVAQREKAAVTEIYGSLSLLTATGLGRTKQVSNFYFSAIPLPFDCKEHLI